MLPNGSQVSGLLQSRMLMEALEQRGNVAEALLVYDRLRVLLRDELGIAPSQAVQSVYRRLLGEATTTAV